MNATQERFKPEEYSSYVEGDIVCLKSGGPDMVVLSCCPAVMSAMTLMSRMLLRMASRS